MTTTTTASDPTPFAGTVPYAIPVSRPARGWAGAAILVGGLCMIGLGGCFLIGVMAIVQAPVFGNMPQAARTLTGEQTALMVVLYVLAFASFAGAAALLIVGTRALLRLLQ